MQDLKIKAFDQPSEIHIKEIIFLKKILWLTLLASGLQIGLRYIIADFTNDIYFCFEIPLFLFVLLSKNKLHDSSSSRIGGFDGLMFTLILNVFLELFLLFFEKSISIWIVIPIVILIIRFYVLFRGYKLLNS